MNKGWVLFLAVIITHSCGVDADILQNLSNSISIPLLFPENNSNCTEGVIVSETESELVFKWEVEVDNSPYTLSLTNLSTNETLTYESKITEVAIVLERGIFYSWSVTGSLNTRSEIWSFFNAGPGEVSTVPLPATAISPIDGTSISQTSTSVNLLWSSEDAHDDIIGYDLYFGLIKDPQLYGTDITETRFDDIPVKTGTIYYWKIVTKDSKGNESISPVFTFSVG